MRTIVLVDHTTGPNRPPSGALELIATAVTRQVADDFAPRWGLEPVPVRLDGDGERLHLFDHAKNDDYGFHQVLASGEAFAHVAVAPSLVHSHWLDGPDAVSASVSHEVLEMIADPGANTYAYDAFNLLWMREVCDAVQEHTYPLAVDGTAVSVSDFVLPSFFNHWAPRPYDFMNKLSAPFTIEPNGYAMVQHARPTDREIDGPRIEATFGPGLSKSRQAEKLHKYGRAWWRLEMQPKPRPPEASTT